MALPFSAPRLAAAILFWCFLAMPSSGGAQSLTPGIGAADETPEVQEAAPANDQAAHVNGLVKSLEDPEARAELIRQLRALTAAEAGATAQQEAKPQPHSVDEISLGLVELLRNRINLIGRQLVQFSSVIVDLPDLSEWLLEQVTDPNQRGYWTNMVGKIALVLFVGFFAYYSAHRLLRKTLHKFEHEMPTDLVARLPLALLRAAIRMLPIIAFAASGYATIPFLDDLLTTEILARSLVDATVVCMALTLCVRTILAPSVTRLRLLEMPDRMAAYIFTWMKRFIYLIAYSYVFFQNELVLQIPSSVYGGVERALGLIVAILVIFLVLRNRRTVAQWLRGTGRSETDQFQRTLSACRRLIADIWPVFAIFYVISTYLIWALNIPGGFTLLFRGAILTTFLLAISRPLAYGVERMLGRGLTLGPDVQRRYPALEPRINRYLGLLQGFAVSLVYFTILLALVQVWGFDLFAWIGGWFSQGTWDRISNAGLVLLITFVIWEAISTFIENYLEAVDDSGTKIERSGRARTLLPLLRTFLFLLIAVIVTLTTLSTLGVDVTPVLAAAGVIGIAIGFGSQKLVQDIINGLFILFQDTIAVGEVVDVAGHGGLVENISVRTIALRDLSGRVHTIPFSEVTTITNHTKGFSFAELDIGIGYRENVDEVMEVVRQIGADLEADPEFGQYTLEPIEVLGIDQFADSAVIIKARIKTRALKQWYVKREFNRLMKNTFDELGIEIPYPHQTLYFGEDKTGNAPVAHVKLDPQELSPSQSIETSFKPAKPLRVVEHGQQNKDHADD